jgi:hypothetical protein
MELKIVLILLLDKILILIMVILLVVMEISFYKRNILEVVNILPMVYIARLLYGLQTLEEINLTQEK